MKSPQVTSYLMMIIWWWYYVDSFLSKIIKKKRMLTLITFMKYSFRSPRHSNHRDKKKKRERKSLQTGKEAESSCLLMTWHDTENSEDATKILLELFNEFGKITGCKSNIQRSVAFLQTINYQKEKLRKQPALHGKKKQNT